MIFAAVPVPATPVGKTTKSLAQLAVAGKNANLAGYMLGCTWPSAMRVSVQSLLMPFVGFLLLIRQRADVGRVSEPIVVACVAVREGLRSGAPSDLLRPVVRVLHHLVISVRAGDGL